MRERGREKERERERESRRGRRSRMLHCVQCYSETLSLFFEICLVNNNSDNKDESILQMYFGLHATVVCGKASCQHYLYKLQNELPTLSIQVTKRVANTIQSELPTLFICLQRLFAEASHCPLALRRGVTYHLCKDGMALGGCYLNKKCVRE